MDKRSLEQAAGIRDGIVLLNKPAGPTSHDMVDRLRAITSIRQIGHAGTLDPFAQGLLVLLVGDATKRAEELIGLPKSYDALLRLGVESDTHDIAGTLRLQAVQKPPAFDAIATALKQFRGTFLQTPPQFSAIKTQGKKAYEQARKGKIAALSPREITVYKLEVINYHYPLLALTMHVASGTYVRAIARDLGKMLGTGAVAASLTRTRIGNFLLKDAAAPEEMTKNNWTGHLRALQEK
jgi:tRNA pseudouridine55 synthase